MAALGPLWAALACASVACSGSKAPPEYGVTLDRDSVRFAVARGADVADELVHFSFVGDGVVAAYPPDVPVPAWLYVWVATERGNGVATLAVSSTWMDPGTYVTTVRFVTGKSDGSVVKYVDLPVALEVRDTFSVWRVVGSSYAFTRPWGTPSSLRGVYPLGIDTFAKPWHASSTADWVTLSATEGSGPAEIKISIGADTATAVPVGTHDATVTISSDDGLVTADTPVRLVVTAPAASVTGSLAFATVDSLATPPQPVHVAFENGVQGGRWTAATSAPWVKLASTAGTPGVDDLLVHVDSAGPDVPPGHHDANVAVQIDLPGATQNRTVTVTADVAPRVLSVGDVGAAFVSRPDVSTLSKTFLLRDTAGVVDAGWTATPDAPWIAATRIDDAHLALTADAAGLGKGFHTAHVAVASTNPEIPNVETIAVGLTVDDAAAVDGEVAEFAGSVSGIVADPLRPRFYVWRPGSSAIDVRDAYTGASVATLALPSGTVQAAAVSPDGATLYVEADDQVTIQRYDLATGSWKAPVRIGLPRLGTDRWIAVLRPEGHEVLVVGECFVDPTTGAVLGALRSVGPPAWCESIGDRYTLALDADALLLLSTQYSPTWLTRYDLRWDAISGSVVPVYTSGREASAADVATTPDGRIAALSRAVYTYGTGGYAPTGTFFSSSVGGSNVEAGRFGEWYLAAGETDTYDGYDVVAYRTDGTFVGGWSDWGFRMPGTRSGAVTDGLRVSADGQRILIRTDGYSEADRLLYLIPSMH